MTIASAAYASMKFLFGTCGCILSSGVGKCDRTCLRIWTEQLQLENNMKQK